MDRRQRQALTTLRDLQGPPLSILIAMGILRVPVGKKEISTALGRSEKTISKAVDFLELNGYIERVDYRHWQLPGGQLPLEFIETGIFPVSSAETGNSMVSGPTTTTSSRTAVSERKMIEQTPSEDVVVEVESPETVNFTVSEKLQQAFAEAGIGENMWPRLARKSHMTPGYVRAHTEARKSGWGAYEDRNKCNSGFQIHCMLAGDEPPADPDNGNGHHQQTGPCGIYVGNSTCPGRGFVDLCETCEFFQES